MLAGHFYQLSNKAEPPFQRRALSMVVASSLMVPVVVVVHSVKSQACTSHVNYRTLLVVCAMCIHAYVHAY